MPEDDGWVVLGIDPMFGATQLFACPKCAALVAPADEHKQFHLAWHARLIDESDRGTD